MRDNVFKKFVGWFAHNRAKIVFLRKSGSLKVGKVWKSQRKKGNINDFFEILNKEYYYTYIIKDEKIRFLSKGKINSLEQIYNDNIDNILYNEYYTLLYKSLNNINNNKDCKDGLDCINPKCVYKHPLDYNLNKAYKRYILNEKTQNPKFKSTYCKYEDDICKKHEYNRCIFKHNDDIIE